ncbi:MAG TPA: hypothetical protein VMX33_10355 [bacterium]|nr:hypothetical protein [bacterium]
MKTQESQSSPHRTIIFNAIGLLTDAEAAQTLVTLGVRLVVYGPAGAKRSGRSGSWLACGLRSDGVVELWPATTVSGWLPAELAGSGIPYRVVR